MDDTTDGQRAGDGTGGADRRRVRRSAAAWAEVVAQWQASGLPVAVFCRERGLSVASFYGWRRRLASTSGASTSGGGPGPVVEHPDPVAGFVRLRHDGEPDARDRVLRLRFPDGLELQVPADRLVELITVLRPAGGRDATA